MPNNFDLLFLSACPRSQPRLRTEDEQREIVGALSSDRVATRNGITPSTFEEELEKVNAPMVHFSGHGREEGLCFSHEFLDEEFYSPEKIITELRRKSNSVRGMVISACHSATIATSLSKFLDFCIGVPYKYGDDFAVKFSKEFYSILADRKTTVSEAFETSLSRSNANGLDPNQKPYLYPKGKTCSFSLPQVSSSGASDIAEPVVNVFIHESRPQIQRVKSKESEKQPFSEFSRNWEKYISLVRQNNQIVGVAFPVVRGYLLATSAKVGRLTQDQNTPTFVEWPRRGEGRWKVEKAIVRDDLAYLRTGSTALPADDCELTAPVKPSTIASFGIESEGWLQVRLGSNESLVSSSSSIVYSGAPVFSEGRICGLVVENSGGAIRWKSMQNFVEVFPELYLRLK